MNPLARQGLVFSILIVASTTAMLQAAQRGDGDRDRDIDLVDFSLFQLCFETTTAPPIGVDCLAFDFNGDGGVDLADAKLLTAAMLGPNVIPPTITDTAVILGKVLHAGTEDPFVDATITAVFAPATEGEPDLPPMAVTDANGEFRYETVPFEGQAEFLVRIRKDGFAEALRRIEIIAGRCWRVDDAYLNPAAPKVMVAAALGTSVLPGGVLMDPTGQISLEIPPGALQQDSEIGITMLESDKAIRDKLPQFVVSAGTFVDISGVFGDATDLPVTLRVPNIHNLPIGTQVPFGKIDHNTLEWMDLRTAFGGAGTVGVGVVTADGTFIEVEFDHFCTVCAGYCPSPVPPNPPPKPPPPSPPPGCATGRGAPPSNNPTSHVSGASSVRKSEGFLRETISLPAFTELGQPWILRLTYLSSAANPTATLRAHIDYASPRPVERTIVHYAIEGINVEAAFERSLNNQKHNTTFIWDGRNAIGELLPTGSYTYTTFATSLNADSAVALSDIFGNPPTRSFAPLIYPGLTPLLSEPLNDRTILYNLTQSEYGAGWSVINEPRLHFDPDGCVVETFGNADFTLFVPRPGQPGAFDSAADDFSTLARNADGSYTQSFDDGTVREFSAAGRVQRIIDRFGYGTLFSHTGERLTRITSPTGFFHDLAYVDGKLSTIVDSAGRETLFQIDAAGDLVSITDPTGATRSLGYDANHLLIRQTGSRGERTEYDYVSGRVVETRSFDVDGVTLLRRRRFAPSVLNGEVGAALAAGIGTLANPIPVIEERIDVFVDGRDSVRRDITSGDGKEIRFEDPLGRTTTARFDDRGLLISRTRPDGSITEFEYDAFGNRTLQRELFNGAVTRFEYLGPFQSVSRMTDPRGNETSFTYLPNGLPSQITGALLNTTVFLYEDPRFPNLGTTTRDALNNNTTLTYDERGNVLSVTDPLDRTTLFEYDQRGNRSAVVDGRGERTEMQYDSNNRLTQIRDALLQVTELQYDEKDCGCQTDNITRVVFPNLTDMQFQYDGLRRKIGETDQLGEHRFYTFDPEGNLTLFVNRNGERIAFTYDSSGQLIRKELPENDLTTYAYDVLGNLSLAENSASRLTFDYDGLGRLTATTQTLASGQGFVPAAKREESLS